MQLNLTLTTCFYVILMFKNIYFSIVYIEKCWFFCSVNKKYSRILSTFYLYHCVYFVERFNKIWIKKTPQFRALFTVSHYIAIYWVISPVGGIYCQILAIILLYPIFDLRIKIINCLWNNTYMHSSIYNID